MPRSWHVCVFAQLLLFGCGNDLGYDGLVGVDGGVDGGGGGGGGGSPGQLGLPCDVQSLLSDHCQGCHGSTPSNGAPISLVTHADLARKDASGATIAERALTRMQSAAAQMPPPPGAAVPPAEIAIFEAWVNAGALAADCTTAPGPFDGPPVCSSGQTWTGGNRESPLMHPGGACIACHAASKEDEAPRFAIAGTVYPTGHEPNDCYGATAATVEVTDANGAVTTLTVNAAGNFFLSPAIPFPVHVAVVAGGKQRTMAASPPSGDCNSCHTQSGANGAPGRIALP